MTWEALARYQKQVWGTTIDTLELQSYVRICAMSVQVWYHAKGVQRIGYSIHSNDSTIGTLDAAYSMRSMGIWMVDVASIKLHL